MRAPSAGPTTRGGGDHGEGAEADQDKTDSGHRLTVSSAGGRQRTQQGGHVVVVTGAAVVAGEVVVDGDRGARAGGRRNRPT